MQTEDCKLKTANCELRTFNLKQKQTMHHWIFTMTLLLGFVSSHAQEAEIRSRIISLFDAMYKRDTASIRQCFIPAAQLISYSYDAKGNPRVKAETVTDFNRGVSLVGDASFEERLTGWQLFVDDGIASVWTPYEFYFEGKFSHCGVNSFELIHIQGNWKISSLTDTRRRSNCPDGDKEIHTIDSLMNAWHHAAAIADEDAFFGRMTEDGIYIGTDPTERWLRDELKEWSKEYFKRETAWAFTPLSRNIIYTPGAQIAWLDELLDTWMGVCRSTAILKKMENEWMIVHYHLSIAIPNDKLDGYRVLIGKE